MRNHKILSITRIILNIYWYFQLAVIASILFIGLLLLLDVQFIDLNNLNGFKIHFSKIIFSEPLIYNGSSYDFSLTNGEGRLHIDNLDQKFVYLRMLAALVGSLISLLIIYFLRKIFKNLTDNQYFVAINGLYIKRIAMSIMLLAFVPGIIHYLTDKWIIGTIKLNNVVIKNDFNFQYETILLGLLVFVISIIFLRGIELKEDQELTI
jgi:hypothetical protein